MYDDNSLGLPTLIVGALGGALGGVWLIWLVWGLHWTLACH